MQSGGKERTASEYKQLLEKHGFVDVQVKQVHPNMGAIVVNGAQIADFLASDWSSDVISHVMGGNRGPGGKRDRGLTGSHVIWGNR